MALERKLWLFIGGVCVLCLLLSWLFQNYLLMQPCTLCVYIRLDFVMMVCGALVGLLGGTMLGLGLGFYGAFCAFLHAMRLEKTYSILLGETFGSSSSCELVPRFPFHLALDEFLPSFFFPTGLCGLDAARVEANASSLQLFFATLYSQGWFLLPKWQILNMAECILIIALLNLTLLSLIFARLLKRDRLKGFFTLVLTLFLGFFGYF